MPTLTVTNWDRWQSYRADRGQPPWIKLHRTVMRNPEWLALTDEQRGHLVQIWLIAADKHGVIIAPDVAQFVQKACGCANPPDLKRLETLRFISVDANLTPELRQPDANVTPTRRQLDAPEESREEESREEESSRAREVCKICGHTWPSEYGTKCHQCKPTRTQADRPPGPPVDSEFSWNEADQAALDAAKKLEAISRTNLL